MRFLLVVMLVSSAISMGACGREESQPFNDERDAFAASPEATTASPEEARANAGEVGDSESNRVASGSQGRRGPEAYLPSERMLLTDDSQSVAAQKVELTLRSEDFAEYVRRLGEEMARDREAQDLAKFYKDTIEQQLDELQIDQFACGVSVCVGSVLDSAGNAKFDAWVKEFFNSPSTPHSSFIYLPLDRGDGVIENRFFFSSDPGVEGITSSSGGRPR